MDSWQPESPCGPDGTRQPQLAGPGDGFRSTELLEGCQGFQLEASRRARFIRSERVGSALGTIPGAVIGNRSNASATILVRFFIGVYASSYTPHSTKEVLDDGLSGRPVEVADGAETRSRPYSDPASLIRGGSALREAVSLVLTLPSRVNGLEQALNELPDEYRDKLRAVLEHEISDNTRRNYRSQWRRFEKWAERRNVSSMPAEPPEVMAYLLGRLDEGHSPSTLRASVSAISYEHTAHEKPDPCRNRQIRRILSAATRMVGGLQKQAKPLTEEVFDKVQEVACQPRIGKGGHLERPETASKRGNLDIAMIGMMRDGLLRVSEAAAATWSDIEERSDGSGRLLIRRSKTDQEGKGAIAYLSVPTMSHLKRIRNGAAGADRVIGLRPNQIGKRIKRAAQQAGLGADFSGHSCRVGMACDLAREGIDLPKIMTAGRWSSLEMVAHYTRSELAGWNAVSEYHGYRYRA